MGMKGDTENMKHVWQIFLFLTVLVSCLTGCGRRQAMEIEEETFPAVSSFEEESQEETEVSRGPDSAKNLRLFTYQHMLSI